MTIEAFGVSLSSIAGNIVSMSPGVYHDIVLQPVADPVVGAGYRPVESLARLQVPPLPTLDGGTSPVSESFYF